MCFIPRTKVRTSNQIHGHIHETISRGGWLITTSALHRMCPICGASTGEIGLASRVRLFCDSLGFRMTQVRHLSKMCVTHWMCYYTELLVGRPCVTSLRKGLVWCGATLLLYIWSPGNLLYLLPCVASAGTCCCLNIRARSSLRFDRYPVSA